MCDLCFCTEARCLSQTNLSEYCALLSSVESRRAICHAVTTLVRTSGMLISGGRTVEHSGF